jgi:hypothetical protein
VALESLVYASVLSSLVQSLTKVDNHSNFIFGSEFLIRFQELASLLSYYLLSIQINIFYIQLHFSQDCAVSNLPELPDPHSPQAILTSAGGEVPFW